jgi:hypothetical protein
MSRLTIWKFPVNPGTFKLEMPIGARVLCVQVQKGSPFMWALCDEEACTRKRAFVALGTNHTAGPIQDWRYIGSFQLEEGELVFHLFEESCVL